VVRARGRVLVVKLGSESPRWAGLWTFPQVERRPRESGPNAARRAALEHARLEVRVGDRVGTIPHTITRFRITLDAFEARLERERTRLDASDTRRFLRAAELEELAMPAPHRRLARMLLAGEERA
jgi:adenine-specific DNA glycosylase